MQRCLRNTLRALIGLALVSAAYGKDIAVARKNDKNGDDLFTGAVPRIEVQVSAEGLEVLRDYQQVWRQKRPERIDVQATVREGGRIYTNVAVHLKGSFSFQPIDGKPSLTLNFDKFAPEQKFHGLTKIHLNNSVQDPSYLCEQLARELFAERGIPAPRATPARVKLNGRDLGVSVLIEGANKQFVKRNFDSTKGNLYDGGSGGDVTKALNVHCGENPDDRSDLTNLVNAARERDVNKRLARLEQVLDVERFITFGAIESFIVHWDGYSIGCNNYRVFHDVSRDKMVFIPHGLDQLFGVSSSPSLSLTPVFKGMVAKALFATPGGRRRYLQHISELSTNEFRAELLHAHVERLAVRLRPALADDRQTLSGFEQALRSLKVRITQRANSVAQQLKAPKPPAEFVADSSPQLTTWSFKGGPTQPATGTRMMLDNHQVLRVTGRGTNSSGAWRSAILLGKGHYEFSGNARTEGITSATKGTNGVILRISGERSIRGLTISDEWKTLRYEFEVIGTEDVELICEFRGPEGSGFFDVSSLRLTRREP